MLPRTPVPAGLTAATAVVAAAGVAGVIGMRVAHEKYIFGSSLDDAFACAVGLALLGFEIARGGRGSLLCRLRLAAACFLISASSLAAKVGIVASSGTASLHGTWPATLATALAVVACAAGFSAFGVALRAARNAAKVGDDEEAAYVKLDEDSAQGKAGLKLGDILWLLKPYFWPSSGRGKVAVISTMAFVSASKVCNVVAPLFLSTAANSVASGGSVRKTVLNATMYAVLSLLSKVLKEGQALAYLRVQKYAFIDLASDTFRHLHGLSLQWALSKKMGEVVRVTDRGIAGCDTFMKYGVLYIGPSFAEALAVCALFYVHFKLWSLALLVFCSVVFYAVLTVKLTLWRKRFRSAMNDSDNKWHDRLTDSLVNFETVKYFTAEDLETERFSSSVASYQTSSNAVQASLSFLNIAQQVILCGCLGGALILSAIGVRDGDVSVGGFVAVNVWVIQLFAPLNFLGTVYNALITALVDLRNLSQLLAEKPLVTDADGAGEHPGHALVHRNKGLAVQFDDVFFSYPGTTRAGLKGVSFTLGAGESLGICGHTGAGKTTMGRLLFRFFDVNSGAVRVGGLDVRAVTQKSLRKLLGVVPQDTVLFNESILYNINYGRPGASEADLHEACKAAALLDFIQLLDLKWDTVVGERGLKLSGGEKQRVAIARMFMKNPPVVLLDEATSALDSKTESQIQAALLKLSSTRTSISIAHRLGTIAKCTKILVLGAGAVAECGTHAELVQLQGEYASMWAEQAHDRTEFDASPYREETKEA
ncbi:P-loop containing nucleoside triphosphate hydrolase protein [Pelagophyceae sp. CCMP2097]|nr:P-loop containing nucleoside triphosphate hydrolase protein [Pelagophyceae sp. CCMP2097]